ncbi:MAG: alpha/beta hydrolase family protein [Polymorphobacter sp.]
MLRLIAALLLATPALAVPAALVTDPPVNAAHPADLMPLLIASQGSNMNGRIYLAAGAGPHPTMLLLHGFPGVEQNGDIAQVARRAGWNVILFHYRGAWGSQGAFSIHTALADTQVVLDWARSPANAAKYRIDPKRIVVAGHSMGGFMAVQTAAHNPGLAGVILIDAWNPAAGAAGLSNPQAQAAVVAGLAESMPPISGITAQGLFAEMAASAAGWNNESEAPALAKAPLLIFGGTSGSGGSAGFGAINAALAKSVAAVPGAKVTSYIWPTDHYLSDHRVAMSAKLVEWLQGLPR